MIAIALRTRTRDLPTCRWLFNVRTSLLTLTVTATLTLNLTLVRIPGCCTITGFILEPCPSGSSTASAAAPNPLYRPLYHPSLYNHLYQPSLDDPIMIRARLGVPNASTAAPNPPRNGFLPQPNHSPRIWGSPLIAVAPAGINAVARFTHFVKVCCRRCKALVYGYRVG